MLSSITNIFLNFYNQIKEKKIARQTHLLDYVPKTLERNKKILSFMTKQKLKDTAGI